MRTRPIDLPRRIRRPGMFEGGDGSTLSLDFTAMSGLDSRFTFSRASTATFINSSGLVQYADHNLVRQSESLATSPWAVSGGVSVSDVSTTNPIGGPTSSQLTAGGGSSAVAQDVTVSGGLGYVVRFWIRAGTSTQAQFGYFASGVFQTGTPTVVSGSGSVSGTGLMTVTGLTSSWTQLQIVYPSIAATGNIRIYPDTAVPVTGRTIFVWGVQMNQGSSAMPYNQTTTAAYHAPRFDHDPATLQPRGLLIEGSATNVALQSDTLPTPTNWVANSITRTNVSTVTPDGNTTATTCGLSHTGSGSFRSNTITVTASTAYTFSFWAKNNGGSVALYRAYNVSGSADIVAETSYFSQINGSTWTRVQFTFTTPVGCTSVYVYPLSQSSGTSNVLIWGAQLEASSGASSYIPTGSGTVQRAADLCSISGSAFASFYGAPTGWTVAVRAIPQSRAAGQFPTFLAVRSAADSGVRIYYYNDGPYNTAYRFGTASTQADIFGPNSLTYGVSRWFGASVTSGAQIASSAGVQVGSTQTLAVPMDQTVMGIGNDAAASPNNHARVHIQTIKFWPRAFSVAELNAVTT